MTIPHLVGENVPLAERTTLGVGGPARYLCAAATEGEVRDVARAAADRRIPLMVLGGGSNVLFGDVGFDGVVLELSNEGSAQRYDGELVRVTAGAGLVWDELVAWCCYEGWAGIECLSGIPGRVGAAPSRTSAPMVRKSPKWSSVYAFSIAQHTICASSRPRPASSVIETARSSRAGSSALLCLKSSCACAAAARPNCDMSRYDIASRATTHLRYARYGTRCLKFVAANRWCTIRMTRIIEAPAPSSPIPSYRRNVQTELSEQIRRELNETLPVYEATPGMKKLSAAWLIEHSGFRRGYVRDRVGLSTRHALALINRGGASAADVAALGRDIQAAVESKWTIQLDPEPTFVGIEKGR